MLSLNSHRPGAGGMKAMCCSTHPQLNEGRGDGGPGEEGACVLLNLNFKWPSLGDGDGRARAWGLGLLVDC